MKKETKHTPGPWSFIDADGYNTIEGAGETIACIPSADHFRAHMGTPEGQANRRLIAAAPDLLEALVVAKKLIESAEHKQSIIGPMNVIREAIAKAKGGE